MAIWYMAYFLTGYFLGCLFFFTYKKIVRPGITRGFFGAFGKGVYGMLKGDESEFWHHYLSVIQHSLYFMGIQFIAVILALCPSIVMMTFVNGPVQSHFNCGAPLAVYPEAAGEIRYPDETDGGFVSPKSDLVTVPSNTAFALLDLKGGKVFRIEDPFASHALCRENVLLTLVMKASGFTVLYDAAESAHKTGLVVVRPLRGHCNPLWPYLNDLDFLFLIGLCLSNLLLMLFRRYAEKSAKDGGYEMGFVDYMLTWIATSNIGLMVKAGKLENKLLQRRLDKTAIEKPIFVSGLARSGTTILLESLSCGDRTASHLYKDFPFIMTPVVWSFSTRVFSSKQKPIERPHKDRIKITRDSPDAFEEPIWQHFFPHVHDPSSTHILGLENNKPDFKDFYMNHIRKIMILRKGKRYLSKGNYNLIRFEYICSILSDAQFIILIRHPLFHVDSLVLQHKLFVGYSKENQQVPEYLKAAGHYEFGPQRMPIILSQEEGARIIAAWDEGRDSVGYAIQWAQIYRFIVNLLEKEKYAEHIRIVRYEDLCAEPYEELSEILSYLDLSDSVDVASAARKISASTRPLSISESEIDLCWQEVEAVARLYGYTKDVNQMEPFSQKGLLKKYV